MPNFRLPSITVGDGDTLLWLMGWWSMVLPTANCPLSGDLDGDTFLVVWDLAIVDAVREVEPARYDAARERQAGRITMQHMVR